MAVPIAFGEALLLGLSSGPACVASCGPVVVPSVLAEQEGLRSHARYLSAFLATRLAGYLVFAAVAYEAGALIDLPPHLRILAFGIVHILLASALVWYALAARRGCGAPRRRDELVTIGDKPRHSLMQVASLGFLTGVSVCPPFIVAGVRAAQAATIAGALFFFVVFFAGTSVWFVPFAGFAWIRRNDAINTVARMAMVLIALFYFAAGVLALAGKNAYGY